MAKIIVVDEQRCLGCKSCQIACAMAHSEVASLAEAAAAEVRPQPRVHVEARAGGGGLPLQCRHCEDAPCVAVCPTSALHREDPLGPVLIDADKCIGCSYCLMVCPFGVIERSRDGRVMIKCDQCFERTRAGEDPACVAACPTRGLRFVELDEYLRQRRRQAAERVTEVARPAGADGGQRLTVRSADE